MITAEEAFKLLQKNITPNEKTISIELNNSLGYVLASNVFSPINMPPFRQSAMDGYALNLHDKSNYKIIDEVKAGDEHQPILNKGEAVRIFTGSAVPKTANTVIMQEKVTVKENHLLINNSVSENKNIRPLGEQIKKGTLALKKGTKLTPAAIGFLLTLGISKVLIFEKPKIGILTTGNELIEAGQKLTFGKIYESNSGMLKSSLQNFGFSRVSVSKVKDDYQSTLNSLRKIISENDLILISGGISVGDYDFVGKALIELGTQQIFYKVKQKPGKPLFFGKLNSKPIFALPGNPASALSNFYVYVHPTLERLSGNINFSINKGIAILESDFKKKGDRAQFLKAHHENGKVTVLEGQSSAMLHTFATANVLVYIPWNRNKYEKGDIVEIIHFPT
jgi:molybdopterin molybdotransferase